MLFDDRRPTVNLRGKSDKQDRAAVLAARDARLRERRQQKAALALQAASRSHADLKRLRASLRAQFDATAAAVIAAGGNTSAAGLAAFAHRAARLVRLLCFFHDAASDGARRRWLLELLLESCARSEPGSNAAVLACSGLDGAASWYVQCSSLVQLCLPLIAEQGASSTAPLALELRAALLLTEPPAAAAAASASHAACLTRLALTQLHGAVGACLHRLFPPAAAPPTAAPSHHVAALLLLSSRALDVLPQCGSPATAAACAAAFARELLGAPALLSRLPQLAVSQAFAPHLANLTGALAPVAAPFAAQLTAAPAWSAAAAAPSPRGCRPPIAGGDGSSLPLASCVAGNLAALAAAVGPDASQSNPAPLAALLHALLPAMSLALDAPKPADARSQQRPGSGAESSDDDEAPSPMAVEGEDETPPSPALAAWQAAAPVWRQGVSAQLLGLGSQRQLGAMIQSSLLLLPSPDAVAATAHLCAVFCTLLYGGPAAAELHPAAARLSRTSSRASGALNALAFGSGGQPSAVSALWRAAQLVAQQQQQERQQQERPPAERQQGAVMGGGSSSAGASSGGGGAGASTAVRVEPEAAGALLATFCAVFSQLLVLMEDDDLVVERESATARPASETAAAPIQPFCVEELRAMCSQLRDAGLSLQWQQQPMQPSMSSSGIYMYVCTYIYVYICICIIYI